QNPLRRDAMLLETQRFDAARNTVERCHRLERIRQVAKGDVSGNAGSAELPWMRRVGNVPDRHEPGRIGQRQRLEEHRVEQTEHQGVRSDPECERNDGSRREAWGTRNPAYPGEEIRTHLVEPSQTSRLADLILVALQGAELETGTAVGVRNRHAFAGQVAD